MIFPVYGTFLSAPLLLVAMPLALWAGTDSDRSIEFKGKIALGACIVSVVMQTLWWLLAFGINND